MIAIQYALFRAMSRIERELLDEGAADDVIADLRLDRLEILRWAGPQARYLLIIGPHATVRVRLGGSRSVAIIASQVLLNAKQKKTPLRLMLIDCSDSAGNLLTEIPSDQAMALLEEASEWNVDASNGLYQGNRPVGRISVIPAADALGYPAVLFPGAAPSQGLPEQQDGLDLEADERLIPELPPEAVAAYDRIASNNLLRVAVTLANETSTDLVTLDQIAMMREVTDDLVGQVGGNAQLKLTIAGDSPEVWQRRLNPDGQDWRSLSEFMASSMLGDEAAGQMSALISMLVRQGIDPSAPEFLDLCDQYADEQRHQVDRPGQRN